jgi:predicted O-methyltransferase YrrM
MRECATTLAAEMSTAEHQLLVESLVSLSGQGLHLEIGTAAGGTLCAMMAAFPADKCPKFVVIDPLKYFPNQLETIQRNLRDHHLDASKVEFRASSSAKAFPKAAAQHDEFDFILVDGCHRISSVMLDLKWTRLLKAGGLICFHDYKPKFPGVQMSVDRLLRRHPNYVIEGQADSLLVVRKRSASRSVEIDLSDEWFARFWSVSHRVTRKLKRLYRAA